MLNAGRMPGMPECCGMLECQECGMLECRNARNAWNATNDKKQSSSDAHHVFYYYYSIELLCIK